MLRTVIILCLFFHAGAHAHSDGVDSLYQAWHHASLFNTATDDKQQLLNFVKQAQQLCTNLPNDPQACALSGMIKGYYAGQVDKLQSLKFAKQARNELQQALALNPKVYDGEAYAELGMLYHQTPGWPFSFGSQPMAERLLRKALEIEPLGVLTNLRLGEFLYNQKRYQDASQYLQTALILADQQEQQSWLDYQLLHAREILKQLRK